MTTINSLAKTTTKETTNVYDSKKISQPKSSYIKLVEEPTPEKSISETNEQVLKLKNKKNELEKELEIYKNDLTTGSNIGYEKICKKAGVNVGAIVGTGASLAALVICTGGVGVLPILAVAAGGFLGGATAGYFIGDSAANSQDGIESYRKSLAEKVSKLETEIAQINSELKNIKM